MKQIKTTALSQPIPEQPLEERLVVESRILAILPVKENGSVDVNCATDKSKYVRLELRTVDYETKDARQITEFGQLLLSRSNLNQLKKSYDKSRAIELHHLVVGCIYQDKNPTTAQTKIVGVVPLVNGYSKN